MVRNSSAAVTSHVGHSRERILSAAESLFAQHGYSAVSMSAIAERADVSKANVFHHFLSKHALYLAVLQRACHRTSEHLTELHEGQDELAQRLARFAHGHLGNLLDHAPVSRLVLRELLAAGPSHGQELAEQVYGEHFRRFVDILRRGQGDGELRGDLDPAVIATILVGADVFFFQARDVLRHFPDVRFADDAPAFSRMLIEILLFGIAPREAAATPAPNQNVCARSKRNLD